MDHNVTPPLITIITVVFNGAAHIEKTILSVLNQRNSNVEYLLIDGGSTDGTLDIISKYINEIDFFISESDSGIYDAMNKGIRRALGSWINFLNAGDSLLFDLNTLSNYNHNSSPFVYGVAIVKDIRGVTLYESGKKIIKRDFLNSMPICHQAIFYSRLYITNYDTKYKIIADRAMTYSIMNDKYIPIFDDKIKIEYMEGGMSYGNIRIRAKEELMFLREINKINTYHVINIIYIFFIKLPIYNMIRSNKIASLIYSRLKNHLLF